MKTKIHPNNLYSFLKSKSIEWVDFSETTLIFHFTDGTLFEVYANACGGVDGDPYMTWEGFDNK